MPQITSIIREDVESIVHDMNEILQAFSNTTIVITGAVGFLCSYFLDIIEYFNRSNPTLSCRVIAVDNFKTGLPERIAHLSANPNFYFLRHDISQPIEIDEPVDWIIHGASIASPTFYRRFPLETIEVNVNGTRYMLELAKQKSIRSMIYLSSSEVYGDPDPAFIPTPENYWGKVSCLGPRACYDESKRLGETLCTIYYRLYDIPVKIIRPFNVFGPGQRLDDLRIIPDFMSSAIKHEPIVLFSDGKATRAFCYVSDAIRGMLFILFSNANGEAFNVGNDREISINALVEKMVNITDSLCLPIEYRASQDINYLTDNPQRRCPDLTKLRLLTSWSPKISLEEGLARTLKSYRELEIEEA